MTKGLLYISTLILLLLPGRLFAQQKPLMSQYTLNKYVINPALAGATGYTNINFTARQMYSGFQNSPRSFLISANTRLLGDIHILKRQRVERNSSRASRIKNIGLGGIIFNDRNGIMNRTGMQLTYGYHINFDGNYQLSFGLSLTGYQFKIDDQNALILDPDDPLLQNNKTTFFVPDANTGIYFSGYGLYAGLSITELFGSSIKLGANQFESYESMRHFYLMGGYKWAASKQIFLEPSFLARGTIDRVELDLSAKLYYQKIYWLGFTYRTNETIVIMAGLSIQEFYLGYAYDASLGAIQTYGGSSHEIIVGMRIGENSTRRFRWLRPDVSEVGE
ncbi:MAG TPA: type IX secretion system membrane protein PorP/SprF [Bacteroides sp.]|nr:type IX secretion system membrane protein PorP/SprF [Bacteroides sp.]